MTEREYYELLKEAWTKAKPIYDLYLSLAAFAPISISHIILYNDLLETYEDED